MGIDLDKLAELDIDFENHSLEDTIKLIHNESSPGKMFPRVPSCVYKGKTVPGYVTFLRKEVSMQPF